MAKVKATELIDVRIDFVSLVNKGANGEKFSIFKSANYKPEKKSTESIELNETEANLFQKILKFFKIHKEEEPKMDEILAAIKGLSEKVEDMNKKVSDIETKIEKEEPDETPGAGKEGDGNGDTPATDEGKGEGNTPATDTGDGDASASEDKESGEEIQKAVKTMTESITKMSERLENIEKKREPSQTIQKDADAPTGDSVFSNIF